MIKPLVILAIIVLLLVGGFFIFKPLQNTNDYIVPDDLGEGENWKEATYEDIRTGESFKITDFSGKPVLLESFAVWCPTCTKQQGEIKKFHEDVGDSVVSISLNTDPNEDERKIKSHIESNGFDWYYAVSPSEVTKSLVDEFGTSFVNAPSVPMLLICPDGRIEKLKSGLKDVEFLKSKINEC